ncbi:MAG: Holliday junction resolvase RuvX [Gemmataceae bacterium]|nr:Holliday junction resolvase RuvX [Gemmataceae bacterium]
MKPRTRILSLDHGKVRLGLAVSDPDRRISSPLMTYVRKDLASDERFLKRIVEEQEIGEILLGLPVHLNGAEGEQAKKVRAFAELVRQWTGLPVALYDERFTSVEAESHLWAAGLTHKKRKDRRDQIAAQILLQTYIDARCPKEDPAGPL